MHRTETCDEQLLHLLTHVETTVAPAADVEQLPVTQQDLAHADRLPTLRLLDGGYVRARNLISGRDDHQIDLVGPIYEDRQWQAKARTGFDVAHFRVDWEARVVSCPRDRLSARRRLAERRADRAHPSLTLRRPGLLT
ncbi:MAG: hypothetical protein ACRDJE_27760 [Dehalococcoidia bacterium]